MLTYKPPHMRWWFEKNHLVALCLSSEAVKINNVLFSGESLLFSGEPFIFPLEHSSVFARLGFEWNHLPMWNRDK